MNAALDKFIYDRIGTKGSIESALSRNLNTTSSPIKGLFDPS